MKHPPYPLAEPSSLSVDLDVLHTKTWSHALLRLPGTRRHFLSVVVGSHAVYSVCIELSPEELQDFDTRGKAAIDALAWAITGQPGLVRERQIRLPDSWRWSAVEPGLLDTEEAD